MDELFETWDDEGRPRGLVPRSRVHREGHWHRASNVFVFRPDGRILLQRRRADKDVCPGLWDTSVAEHLKPGETHEQGAIRGLREELGIEESLLLEPLGGVRRVWTEIEASGIRDRELQLSFRCVWAGPVSPDPAEVDAVAAYRPEEALAALARRPEAFTPWFRQSVADLEPFGGELSLARPPTDRI